MKKSEKKKLVKQENIKYHQHKSITNGVINIHGFPHSTTSIHKKDETRKSHELTIQIDSGLILIPQKEQTNG